MIATWPFQNTRSPRWRRLKPGPGSMAAPIVFGLHVGIAQHILAGHPHGELDQSRAVDAETGVSTPEIGRVDERLGNGNDSRPQPSSLETRCPAIIASPDGRMRVAGSPCFGEASDGDARPNRQFAAARQLHVRAGIDEGSRGADDMRDRIACRSRAPCRRRSRHNRPARPGPRPSLRAPRTRAHRRRTGAASSRPESGRGAVLRSATGTTMRASRPGTNRSASTLPRSRSSARSGRKACSRRSWAVICGSSPPLAMMTSPKRSTNKAPSTVRLTSTLRLSRSSRWRETSFMAPIVSSARVITGLVTSSFAASPRTVCGGGSR